MATRIEVRRAGAEDIDAVRDIVLRAVRETNGRDYPASVIDRLASTLPDAVASKLQESHAYVAVVGGRIVGTARLNGNTVSSVFVCPDHQGQGIGTKLMDAIESIADVQSSRVLTLQSSITAQAFYANRGFKVVSESSHGEERTVHMSKETQPGAVVGLVIARSEVTKQSMFRRAARWIASLRSQ
jgi:GNAT superfamily N-acetyltransferase